ncbi:MAG TPA: ABC transporter ATP-binding protein [Natronosporangium sp.]|nr:ABC transporter ATP-binding protein [Natronosporangium sp.]
MDIIARLDHVTKTYGSVVALDSVSVTIPPGVTAVLGPNGAGKSTMIEILAGLRRPSAGRVEVLGGDPTHVSVRRRLGLTPQATALPWRLTVAETLDLLAAHYPRAVPRESLVDTLDLGGFLHKRNGTLSGGQRRRVALAAALIGSPELVFLDEPSTGLDATSRDRMWSAITEAALRGTGVVLTTHDMAEAEHLAHRVVVIAGGQVARTGSVTEVCAEVGLHLVDFAVTGPVPTLPGLIDTDRWETKGNRVHIYTPDPDRVVRTLVHQDVPFQDIRIDRVGLEEAIRTISIRTLDHTRIPEEVA